MLRLLLMLAVCFGSLTSIIAQERGVKKKVVIEGNVLTMWITEAGDTLLIANLDEMSVSTRKEFKDGPEKLLYEKYRRYAIKVYPYAVQAIKVFREVEYFTHDMSKREKKKRIKKLQKDLEVEFEEPLKNLTKTQGYVLMKMIERELDIPMHHLVKNLRGGLTATYWSTMGRFYGHKLRDGYVNGFDPVLDLVLGDFNISYTVPRGARIENYEDYQKYFGKKKKGQKSDDDDGDDD